MTTMLLAEAMANTSGYGGGLEENGIKNRNHVDPPDSRDGHDCTYIIL